MLATLWLVTAYVALSCIAEHRRLQAAKETEWTGIAPNIKDSKSICNL